MDRRLGCCAALAALVAALTGCSGTSSADGDDDRLRVVTTVAPLTSIVASVAGDRAIVTGLVPEGVNSHTYEPPPTASRVLEKADVVVVNGLRLEEPTVELAKANAPEAEIVALGDAVLPESEWIFDFSFPREDGKPNPHLWTDPTYAIRYAGVVRDALVREDPDGTAAYDRNHDAFVDVAQKLSDALRTDQATLPPGRKKLLTYHDAYAYFARTYGWEVIGAVQPSNFEDPQPREVARIVDQVRTLGVPVVFGSEVFPSPVLEQIARETGARYEDTLRDDDLPGEPGDAEHSWADLMRYDYTTMIKALGGTTSALDALVLPADDDAEYPQ